jgi:hypothetical protein
MKMKQAATHMIIGVILLYNFISLNLSILFRGGETFLVRCKPAICQASTRKLPARSVLIKKGMAVCHTLSLAIFKNCIIEFSTWDPRWYFFPGSWHLQL